MTSILKVDTIQDADGNNIINENSNTITVGAAGDTVDVPGTEVKTNKVSPTSGTSLQIGDSGDTVNIVGTLQNNGAAVGGIEEIDMWRLNNNFSGSGSSTYALINNYWERADTDGFVKKGTGLSESSGIFTFPSTGYYFITWNFETVQNNDEYIRIKMMFGGSSGNNSTVNQDASGANATGYASVTSSAIINCTDVADKFTFYNSTSNGSIDGDSGSNRSGFTCFKLG